METERCEAMGQLDMAGVVGVSAAPILRATRRRCHDEWFRHHRWGCRQNGRMRLERDSSAQRRAMQRHGDEMLELTSHFLPPAWTRQQAIPTPQEVGSQWAPFAGCLQAQQGGVESDIEIALERPSGRRPAGITRYWRSGDDLKPSRGAGLASTRPGRQPRPGRSRPIPDRRSALDDPGRAGVGPTARLRTSQISTG